MKNARIFCLILFLLVTLSGNCVATSTPIDGFLNMPWGMLESDVKKELLIRGNATPLLNNKYISTFLGNQAIIHVRFVEGKLCMVNVTLSGDLGTFTNIAESILSKYGKNDYAEDTKDYFLVGWSYKDTNVVGDPNSILLDMRDNTYLKYRPEELSAEYRILTKNPYLINVQYIDGSKIDKLRLQMNMELQQAQEHSNRN